MNMDISLTCHTVLVVCEYGALFLSEIKQHPYLKLLTEVDSYEAGHRQLENDRPDIMLVDLDLSVGDCMSLIREPESRAYATRTMAISKHDEEEYVIQAIEAGAASYICKNDIPGNISELIVRLAQGGCPLSPSISRHLLKYFYSNPNDTCLSKKETEILFHLVKGSSFKKIARALVISTNTVETHIKHIYLKLGVHSRGEAVFKAIQQGLIKGTYQMQEK